MARAISTFARERGPEKYIRVGTSVSPRSLGAADQPLDLAAVQQQLAGRSGSWLSRAAGP